MFTGIIEDIGTVRSVNKSGDAFALTISSKIMDDVKLGDSIAVNGVCLTARTIKGDEFTADVMAETLRKSSLGQLKPGSKVNLERALSPTGRFGGHIVSGHIDGTGTVKSIKPEGNAMWVEIAAPASILRLIIMKGSIAIDGISLTVADLGDASFKVSVIPHTASETTLLDKKPGDTVNLENDVIGKYVERLLSTPAEPEKKDSQLTLDTLMTNGFI